MNQSFSPNLDLMVSCPSNDPDHASDGIRAPEFISRSRETVGRSVEIGALRRWFADLQLVPVLGTLPSCTVPGADCPSIKAAASF
jgi:hypothetical protein